MVAGQGVIGPQVRDGQIAPVGSIEHAAPVAVPI